MRSGRLAAAVAMVLAGGQPAVLRAEAARPWMNPGLTPDQRADRLLPRLTVDERLGLLHGVIAIPMFGGGLPAGAVGSIGFVPGVPRLGVPALQETDASLGVTNPFDVRPHDGATALPSGLAIAATFDPELAYAGGAMIGREARAKGLNVLLGGGVNLVRDPRAGRNFEYLGEDPLLAGLMAGAAIRGTQDQHVLATVKHFAFADQETGRSLLSVKLGEAAARESDLLAFEIAIEHGAPGAVICAYNRVDGPYACDSDRLLNGVLKGDWAYPGWVMSDWGAVHDASFAAHGLDQESGQQVDRQVWFDKPLRAAVASGVVSPARIDGMSRRILRSMFAAGLFDHPAEIAPIDAAADGAVARRAAAEGVVLLADRDGLLPLARDARSIVVIGGHADAGVLSGAGSSQVTPIGGAARTVPVGGEGLVGLRANMVFDGPSPLSAIRARAPGAVVRFDDGRYPRAAADAARRADIAIVFANQWMGETGDAPDLSLPQGQDALIAAVAAANPRTVVVLQTGGPVVMPWLDRVGAVVEAWYGGSKGADALADVLFGVADAAGRLPVTFPVSEAASPRPTVAGAGLPDGQPFDVAFPEGADAGYRWYAAHGVAPLFPFGFGLSYTRFAYSNLKVSGGRALTVAFDVSNVGGRPGSDAPQAYLTAAHGQARRRLIGFSRVTLAPGETRHVTLTADPRLLADFDAAAHAWRITGGAYDVAVGASSADLALRGTAALTATALKP